MIDCKGQSVVFDALIDIKLGNWNTVFKRFDRRGKSVVLNNILNILISESDFEWFMVDSSVLRDHLSAVGAKGGKRIRC